MEENRESLRDEIRIIDKKLEAQREAVTEMQMELTKIITKEEVRKVMKEVKTGLQGNKDEADDKKQLLARLEKLEKIAESQPQESSKEENATNTKLEDQLKKVNSDVVKLRTSLQLRTIAGDEKDKELKKLTERVDEVEGQVKHLNDAGPKKEEKAPEKKEDKVEESKLEDLQKQIDNLAEVQNTFKANSHRPTPNTSEKAIPVEYEKELEKTNNLVRYQSDISERNQKRLDNFLQDFKSFAEKITTLIGTFNSRLDDKVDDSRLSQVQKMLIDKINRLKDKQKVQIASTIAKLQHMTPQHGRKSNSASYDGRKQSNNGSGYFPNINR